MTAAAETKVKSPSGFRKWSRSRQGQQTITLIAFMVIPLLLLIVFTYIPFGEMSINISNFKY